MIELKKKREKNLNSQLKKSHEPVKKKKKTQASGEKILTLKDELYM